MQYMLTMMSQVALPSGIVVVFKHFLADEMGYILGGSRSGALTLRDYLAAALVIVAGIFQHFSELQRWWFKRGSKNVGKLHSSGLFAYARGINHTGHILRDIAHMLWAPNRYLMLLYVPLCGL
jgi:steroid 5-alpha reductase family enzyme